MDTLHINAIVSANNGRARVISAVVTILIPDRTLHCLSSMTGDGTQDVAAPTLVGSLSP